MSDVSQIINNIFSHLLSTLDPGQGCDANYSFFPTTIYVTLLSLLPYLNFPKRLMDYLEIDWDERLDDPEECQNLFQRLPSLVSNEVDFTLESYIKIFTSISSEDVPDIQYPIHSLFDVEQESISEHECQLTSVFLHDWSKQKLKSRDLRLVKVDPLKPHFDSFRVANTLYFCANWRYPFVEAHTKISHFYVDPDFDIQIETMWLQERLRHCIHPDYNIACVELPFNSPHLSVFIFHSANHHLNLVKLLSKIDGLFLDDCISMFTFSEVAVFLPKMKISDHVSLKSHLKRLDYFKELKSEGRFLDQLDITQAVGLTVNEYGISTKYSPYQSSRMNGRRPGLPRCIHKINSPFIFMIYDSCHRCPIFVSAVFYPARK